MGTSSVTGLETVLFADNISFDGTPRGGVVTTNGQLLIGSTTAPHIKVGTLGSSDGSITWTVGSGTITGQVSGGTSVLKTLTGTSGGAISPTSGNITFSGGTTGLTLVGSGSTLTYGGTLALANGGTNASLTASNGGIFYSTATAGAILAGTATAGQIPRSGANAAPSWSTATYPATAGTSGNVLTSDGTNWNSTAPATNGTVTTVSVATANGFAGTVANATTTPAITISTGVTGVLLGNGTAVSGLTYVPVTTWTPTVQAGGSSTGITYSFQFGWYYRIGDMVYVNIDIRVSSFAATSGNITINNLPIATGASGASLAGITFPSWNGFNSASYTLLSLIFDNSSSVGTIIKSGNNVASGNVTVADTTGIFSMQISGWYPII